MTKGRLPRNDREEALGRNGKGLRSLEMTRVRRSCEMTKAWQIKSKTAGRPKGQPAVLSYKGT